jgi:4-hydroxybenzoate polyprenyltransferase
MTGYDPERPLSRGRGTVRGLVTLAIVLLIVLALVWVLFFPRTQWFEPAPRDDPAAVPTPR